MTDTKPVPSVTIINGDCLEVLRTMPDASVHCCVTDPPYHLTANKKGGSGVASVNLDSPYGRSRIGTGNGAGGFMGQAWDGGDTAFRPETWREVLRVLKPGAHLLAFGGTRTYHRLACAIEDAGFEIRDQIGWAYGQGFPKSHNLEGDWQGWGTALKPAWEPICVARKPLTGTVEKNVQAHGVGALNIDECRIAVDEEADASQLRTMQRSQRTQDTAGQVWGMSKLSRDTPQVVRPEGRWPANLIHDGSGEVLALFPETTSGGGPKPGTARTQVNTYGKPTVSMAESYGSNTGSAARFFYCAKASKADRGDGNTHPTVKPVALIRYLIRLVTPPGGMVLDPFGGSGTTGLAAQAEGFDATLIELNPEYVEIAKRRLGLRLDEQIEKPLRAQKPQEIFAGPLFGEIAEALNAAETGE